MCQLATFNPTLSGRGGANTAQLAITLVRAATRAKRLIMARLGSGMTPPDKLYRVRRRDTHVTKSMANDA